MNRLPLVPCYLAMVSENGVPVRVQSCGPGAPRYLTLRLGQQARELERVDRLTFDAAATALPVAVAAWLWAGSPSGIGTRWDPAAVDAFLGLFDRELLVDVVHALQVIATLVGLPPLFGLLHERRAAALGNEIAVQSCLCDLTNGSGYSTFRYIGEVSITLLTGPSQAATPPRGGASCVVGAGRPAGSAEETDPHRRAVALLDQLVPWRKS